ncbi:hypothetical protein V6N13_072464 [Hibiscus sabdariffa]
MPHAEIGNATTFDPTIYDFVVIIEDVLPTIVIDNALANVVISEPMVANVFAHEIVLVITNLIVFYPIIPAISMIAPRIDVSTVPNMPANLICESFKEGCCFDARYEEKLENSKKYHKGKKGKGGVGSTDSSIFQ